MIEYESQIYNLLNEEEKEKYKKDYEKKINNYINDYCMICGENIKEKNYFKFNLKNDNENILEHLLCEECFKKIDKNNNDLFCLICSKNHNAYNIDNIKKIIRNVEYEKERFLNKNTANNDNNITIDSRCTSNDKNNDKYKRKRKKMNIGCCSFNENSQLCFTF